MSTQEKIKVLYITGSGRSGSTLLEQVLGQVEGLAAIGELRHIGIQAPDLRCGCGKKFQECELWSKVFLDVFGESGENVYRLMKDLKDKVDRVRFIPRMLLPKLAGETYRRDFALYREYYLKLYQSFLKHANAAAIIDSSKDISTLYMLTTMPEVDLHVLHLVRDSRGVAYSYSKRKKLRPEFVDKEVYIWIRKPENVALDWMSREVLIRIMRNRASQYDHLLYNQFISQPAVTIRTVAHSLGVKTGDLSFIDGDSIDIQKANHTAHGNPIRFNMGKIRVKVDNEWCEKMERRDRTIVTLITLPYLLRYGMLGSQKDANRQS